MRMRHPGTLPDPFAGLQVACRELDQVLAQLRFTLIRGPATQHAPAEAPAQASGPQPGLPAPDTAGAPGSSQAWPRSYKSVLSTNPPAAGSTSSAGAAPRQPAPPSQPAARRTDPATEPPASLVTARHEPHRGGAAALQDSKATRGRAAPDTPAPAQPPLQTRPHRQAPVARSATPALPPTPSASPPAAATVAAPPPVDPAAEAAASLRQEQLDALKAVLAPLQDEARRLSRDAEAVGTPVPPATGPGICIPMNSRPGRRQSRPTMPAPRS